MTRTLLLGLAVLSLIICSCSHSEPRQPISSACHPSFRDVSPKAMKVDAGSWQIYFNVALVGCSENLEEISPGQMNEIADALRQPSQWSNLLLLKESSRKDFRIKVVDYVNQIFGRRLVSDVMFHDIRLVDHN